MAVVEQFKIMRDVQGVQFVAEDARADLKIQLIP